jgi:hypothetical protein
MQLPRGTFHSIKKHVTFSSLLEEAVVLRFTGSILISFPRGTSFLVLQDGGTVLAAFHGLCGKEAFRQMEEMGDEWIDAELTSLNTSQLALAKEFNKSCEIRSESGSAIVFGKKSVPRQDLTAPTKPGVSPSPTPRREFGEGEIENLLHGDLEALDRMDLDKMSGKFRMNAESIARELKLDHLGQD